MRKTVIWVLVAVVLVVAVGYGVTRVQARRTLRAALEEIRNNLQTAEVERRDLEVVVSGKGTIQPNEKKAVVSGVTGTVQDVLVNEGSVVEEGQIILIVDNDSVRYQAEQAKLDLRLAEQTLEIMLGPAGAKVKAELDLRQAEANLSSVADRLAALSPVSPIDGEVWSVTVKPGDAVKTGQTLATVADTRTLTVSAHVKQEDLHLIEIGSAVTVYPGGALSAVAGTVSSIANEGVSGPRGVEFPLAIDVMNPGTGLRAGMSVTVTCEAEGDRFLTWGGVTAAGEKVDVRAESDGNVVAVLAEEGLPVAKGQAIVTLENNALVVSHDQAMNAVESAKQSLASCEDQIEQQRLRVQQALVNLNDKDGTLAKLLVKSPIAGQVVSLAASSGETITAAQTLAQVASVEPLTVTIPVDELDVSFVAVDQEARVEVDAFPDRFWTGRVTKIAFEGQVKDGVTNYGVTVSLSSDELRLGMSASATISVSGKAGVLSVPVEAVTWDRGSSYVTVMRDGQLSQVKVKVGIQNDLYSEIVSGLDEGDLVLVGNLPNLGGLRLPTNIPGMRMR